MIEITIDGQKIKVEEGKKILEVARDLKIPIPALCHHKAVEEYGACRLCVVDI